MYFFFFFIIISETCEVLDIKECLPSHEFINPCSCYDSYYCDNYEVKTRPCPEGTAYNGKICDHVKDVLVYNCSIERPWDRCNVSGQYRSNMGYMYCITPLLIDHGIGVLYQIMYSSAMG